MLLLCVSCLFLVMMIMTILCHACLSDAILMKLVLVKTFPGDHPFKQHLQGDISLSSAQASSVSIPILALVS